MIDDLLDTSPVEDEILNKAFKRYVKHLDRAGIDPSAFRDILIDKARDFDCESIQD